MPHLKTTTATLHYRHEGSGEPIVLIHGNWTTSLFWQPVMSQLVANHEVIAPDLRGRGESRAMEPHYSIAHLAADLDSLLEHLSLSHVHLVGHSLGTAVVLEWAMRHRDRTRTITLVSPAWPDGMPAIFHQPERQRAAQENFDLYAVAFRGIAPTAPKDALFDTLVIDGHKQLPEATMATLDALTEWAPGEQLQVLRGIPALVVGGELDPLSNTGIGARCAELLGATHHVMPGVGHSPNLEAPKAFVEQLQALISNTKKS